ncbi:MAG: hypothetical protein JJ956_19200 [Pseudomonadales bacterium]|nr:hypothetical protein [Pseudomonadales bacterium]
MLELSPTHLSTVFNLMGLLIRENRIEDARSLVKKAKALNKNALEWHLTELVLDIPTLAKSQAEIAECRVKLREKLDFLENARLRPLNINNIRANLFPLAYHGIDDLAILKRVSKLVRRSCDLNQVRPSKAQSKNKVRVGFLSGYIYQHTIGVLNRGLIEKLCREKFEIVLLHVSGTRRDQLHMNLNQLADSVCYLSTDVSQAASQVRQMNLDILHYLDIGMNSFSYLLAHFRLAPTQSTSWGHPMTTGIDTIDYFISFDAAEPQDAQQNYSEALVCFESPPVYYYDPVIENQDVDVSVDLPEGNLYGCMQSLFKLHPEFDLVLDRILELDPEAQIVLVEAAEETLTQELKDRWRNAFPRISSRSLFLPRMSRETFLGVTQKMTVLLDTPYFGSGNTLYESLCMGIPSVTWPGPFMRARIAAGLYEHMGIKNAPVASSLAEYAEIAVALATSSSVLGELKSALLDRSSLLYEDDAVVKEFERTFEVWRDRH